MGDKRTPREVRFVCQHCGQWIVYIKTTTGADRYICDDCLIDRKLAMARLRWRVIADQQRKEQRHDETL